MIEIVEQIEVRTFRSEVRPGIETTYPDMAPVIEWADKNPHVYDIVTKKRSKAFGLGSCAYIGWAQKSPSPDAVLERLRHLHELIFDHSPPYYAPDNIFSWRAQFTLAHYRDKGFTGGFFQQHDGQYPRSCLTLDFTPETFEEVLDRFCSWVNPRSTKTVLLDGEVVRSFP
jgi:hypothetical protein